MDNLDLPIQRPSDEALAARPRSSPTPAESARRLLGGTTLRPRTRTNATEKTSAAMITTSAAAASATKADPSTAARHKVSLRDFKAKRSSDRHPLRLGTRLRTRISPTAIPKSLLPFTERKSQEDSRMDRRAKDSIDTEKGDIALDGTSASREGRQFTVANVGNNGRIYLRPAIRPAHLRYPQPNFVFPMTPPGTAGLDLLLPDTELQQQQPPPDIQALAMKDINHTSFLYGSDWTLEEASTPLPNGQFLTGNPPISKGAAARVAAVRRRRALSDSTVQEASAARESEPGSFKIVITQPADAGRTKTLEDIGQETASSPFLEISIPTWKLGTPRFTLQGTPMLCGSSYAPTEDLSRRSGQLDADVQPPSRDGSDVSGLKSPEPVFSAPPSPLPRPNDQSKDDPPPENYCSSFMDVEPSMFDLLTFKPACDSRAIVRFSTTTGSIKAATPARLVAEITSPKFMDYDLVSDFFLTYRTFLHSHDLLCMLIARLRWAISRDEEIGTIVRVRTFVALRHWILNYFMDDFLMDYNLRMLFCNLVNGLVDELVQESSGRKASVKILMELKKCWRRSCAQYWDGAEFDDTAAADTPISPGGIAGHRNPALNPSLYEQILSGESHLLYPVDDDVLAEEELAEVPANHAEIRRSFRADGSRHNQIDSIIMGERPATPENAAPPTTTEGHNKDNRQMSPTSVMSLDFISCSLPTKNLRMAQTNMGLPPAAHPADPSQVGNTAGAVATAPRALMGKRVRPDASGTAHKRNNSLSDSLRDVASTSDRVTSKSTISATALPYAGCLVRGAMFPPSQPFVEVLPIGINGRQTTLFQSHSLEGFQFHKAKASAMSAQGMRKLLGSVRRTISSKTQSISPIQSNFFNISPIGPRGATTNRLPGTAVVPQARPHFNGVRAPIRIDLLGAKIAEDFKIAVREEASIATSKHEDESDMDLPIQQPSDKKDEAFGLVRRSMSRRPFSDTGITTGSKSIVIVDDTLAMDFPFMAGALPALNTSIEGFRADPTPPTTPPGHATGTPRRSSYILTSRLAQPSLSTDALPPFVPNLDTLGPTSPTSMPDTEASMPPLSDIFDVISEGNSTRVRSLTKPKDKAAKPNPTETKIVTGHRSVDTISMPASPSSRLASSIWSHGHGRQSTNRSSFRWRFTPRAIVRSLSATTNSGSSVDESTNMAPIPLRALRRQPGGNLRGVTNVGDLDREPVRKHRSVGSLTTYTESIRSSYMLSQAPSSLGFGDVVSREYSRARSGMFSVGRLAEKKPHSKPMMRPSFEAEAQKLAQIPDDDDGGVESALLKLEGKFTKRPKLLSMDLAPRAQGSGTGPKKIMSVASVASTIGMTVATTEMPASPLSPLSPTMSVGKGMREAKLGRREQHVDAGELHRETILPADLDRYPSTVREANSAVYSLPPEVRPSAVPRMVEDVRSFLSDSGDSYCSTSLLDRGLTDGRSPGARSDGLGNRSMYDDDDDDNLSIVTARRTTQAGKMSHPSSYEIVSKTESLERIKPGETMPQASHEGDEVDSFLDDESDRASELSSELSVDFEEEDTDMFGVVGLGRSNTVASRLPAHALGDPELEPGQKTKEAHKSAKQASQRPPSPPITLVQALQLPRPGKAQVPELYESRENRESKEDAQLAVHLPFILAFDSEVLAQQFTLIEKDALHEIDWKELIEMRWQNAENSNARSWVDFLRSSEARGVEVVIARFNIMVKWAISEVVLTQDMGERTRCLIKLIHIAAHCRRYRNYATMSQLTIALTSNEVARLSRTWRLVPGGDLQTLRELEVLVSPTRNFYSLRAEMEAVGISEAEASCIPFVGIYTHDLLFNAQRSAEVVSSSATVTEPLVNFERCRAAASIVKTLLRLVEASAQYHFQPIEGITERCLWMSALSDEAIRRHSERLEPI